MCFGRDWKECCFIYGSLTKDVINENYRIIAAYNEDSSVVKNKKHLRGSTSLGHYTDHSPMGLGQYYNTEHREGFSR